MLRHIFNRPENDDHHEDQAPSQRGTVRVRLATSSGGARWIELSRDQVDGRTPMEILETAIRALEDRSARASGAEAAADLMFALNARRLMSEQGFGLDASSGEQFLPPNARVSSTAIAHEIFLELGVDHRAG